jgi:ParB family chromosome partitioning protein
MASNAAAKSNPAATKQTKGLGRGLSSLMGEAATIQPVSVNAANEGEKPNATLPVASLRPGKYQPRRHFDEAALTELSESIEKHGLMQPIVVRATGQGQYEIIAGERRWRASKLAKIRDVPVIIREVDDSTALELALIENIQRADLNPLEEAAAYQRLMNEFGYTQEKLAPVVGKSRSHIANLLRLLKLPDSIKQRIDSGELTMGHARALLMASDPEDLAKKIIEIGLSVRQAEELAKGATTADGESEKPRKPSAPGRSRAGASKSDDVMQLENMLADSLGLRVSIDTRGGQAGEVVISYDSLTQLDEILRRLGGGV